MSDICDDAEGVRLMAESGVKFGRRGMEAGAVKPCSSCRLPPTRKTDTFNGKERYECPACGKRTENLRSRQAILVMWNGMN